MKKANRKAPPRAAVVKIIWSDGSETTWRVTDGYADALFETVAGDLGPPNEVGPVRQASDVRLNDALTSAMLVDWDGKP